MSFIDSFGHGPPCVIFVRPQAAGNLGALARVMANFGLRELRLVGRPPESQPFSQMDWGMACYGREILEKARWYETLPLAFEGLHLTVGTSGKGGSYEKGYTRPLESPQQAFEGVEECRRAHGENFYWGLVLGPEDHGLSSEESAHCQRLIAIPTQAEAPSMNVAMAAGVLLYHWQFLAKPLAREAASPGPFPMWPGEKWSDLAEREKFLAFLCHTLRKTEFFKHPDQASLRARLRRWLQATPIPFQDLMQAFEAVYQLRAWGLGKHEPRSFLKTDWDHEE